MRPSQLRRRAGMLLGLSIALPATGCVQNGQEAEMVHLAPMPRPYERDIPVPIGFRFVDSASEDRSTGTSRLYLRHVYQGRADRFDVRQFYRDQMPLANWAKVSDGMVEGEYTMRFVKGTEACTIMIRDSNGFGSNTEVQVIISQEQKGARPPKRRSQE